MTTEVRQASTATPNNDYYLVEKDDMENFMYRCMSKGALFFIYIYLYYKFKINSLMLNKLPSEQKMIMLKV